jgi:protein SCO1/2
MSRALRSVALAVLAVAAGCGPEKPWHATNITGSMPRIEFTMMRASDGTAVNAEEYRGRIVMLYFGYTHCPDICPTTLANLSDVLHRLGPDAEKVRVLFVTVDPNRDSLPVLKQYAAAFAPQMEGLRGTPNQLADLARRYRVAYSVKTQPEYQVMHTSATFVFDETGRARLVTLDTNDTAGLADDVKRIIEGD